MDSGYKRPSRHSDCTACSTVPNVTSQCNAALLLEVTATTRARLGPGLCAARCRARAIPRSQKKHQTKGIITWKGNNNMECEGNWKGRKIRLGIGSL